MVGGSCTTRTMRSDTDRLEMGQHEPQFLVERCFKNEIKFPTQRYLVANFAPSQDFCFLVFNAKVRRRPILDRICFNQPTLQLQVERGVAVFVCGRFPSITTHTYVVVTTRLPFRLRDTGGHGYVEKTTLAAQEKAFLRGSLIILQETPPNNSYTNRRRHIDSQISSDVSYMQMAHDDKEKQFHCGVRQGHPQKTFGTH